MGQSSINWLPVVGYEGLYEVSDAGLVRSIDRECVHKNGTVTYYKGREISRLPNKQVEYLQVSLWKNNKGTSHYVHRLVAQAFIPNPLNVREVNHIDGNRQNNLVGNLEWVTRAGNARHAIATGLKVYIRESDPKVVYEATVKVIDEGATITSVAPLIGHDVPRASELVREMARKLGREKDLDDMLVASRQARTKEHNEQVILEKSKPIEAYDKNTGELLKELPSVAKAHEWALAQGSRTSVGSISNAANGRQNTAGGFVWKFK